MNTKDVGDIGENIACKYLESEGYVTVDRNYRKKWGEIDIVAYKAKILCFIEVKSARVLDLRDMDESGRMPEENVHYNKLRRLKRTVQTYLCEKHDIVLNGLALSEYDVQFRVLAVFLDMKRRVARIRSLENVL